MKAFVSTMAVAGLCYLLPTTGYPVEGASAEEVLRRWAAALSQGSTETVIQHPFCGASTPRGLPYLR